MCGIRTRNCVGNFYDRKLVGLVVVIVSIKLASKEKTRLCNTLILY